MQAHSMSEFRQVVQAAQAQGWTVELTRGSHWRFRSPDRKVPLHITGGSPGNPRRYIKRLVAELRRKGLVIP